LSVLKKNQESVGLRKKLRGNKSLEVEKQKERNSSAKRNIGKKKRNKGETEARIKIPGIRLMVFGKSRLLDSV